MRFLTALLLTTAAVILSPAAHAASSYSVAYSADGGLNITSGGRTSTTNYALYPDGTYGIHSYPTGFGNGTAVSASAQAKITATFTWGGTSGTAPASVVVTETAGAGFTQQNSIPGGKPPTGSGSSSDGLGGSGVRYSVQSGASFSVSESPSASFSGPASSPAGSMYTIGAASKAVASPITINLRGITLDGGANKVLTGQRILANLSVPTGFTASNYQWSVSSKTIYLQYDGKASSKQLTPYYPFLFNDSGCDFYDAVPETVTLTCTATLTAPNNQTLNVSAKAVVQVVKPTVTQWIINRDTGNPIPHGFKVDTANKSMSAIEYWNDVTISVPAPFNGGTACFVQLISPDRTAHRHPIGTGAASYTPKIPQGNADGTISWAALPSSAPYLDLHFPYQFGGTKESDGKYRYPSTPGGYSWSISPTSTGNGIDNPLLSWASATDVDGGGNDWYEYDVNDKFSTWVMYLPPSVSTQGDDVSWVPLQKISWSWTGKASKGTNGNWSATGSLSSPSSGSDATNDFPQWGYALDFGQTQFRP